MKSTKTKRGVSSVIATVLLITLAVAGGSMVYTYAMTSTVNLQQTPSNFSILEIPTGSASGNSIKFYVLNLGKQEITLNGAERVYVTLANQTKYEFAQTGISSEQVSFGCPCDAANGSLSLLPEQTVLFVVTTSFLTFPGYSYSILLVLGDGSETVATIIAN
ncbi:MAG: hypothetical protein PXY39_01950 [archaeon]|nr:hypothetical protein [archaeon]